MHSIVLYINQYVIHKIQTNDLKLQHIIHKLYSVCIIQHGGMFPQPLLPWKEWQVLQVYVYVLLPIIHQANRVSSAKNYTVICGLSDPTIPHSPHPPNTAAAPVPSMFRTNTLTLEKTNVQLTFFTPTHLLAWSHSKHRVFTVRTFLSAT